MAYLNGDDRRYRKEVFVKARVLQERAIALGGRQLSGAALPWKDQFGLNYCGGKLSVSGKVVYVAAGAGRRRAPFRNRVHHRELTSPMRTPRVSSRSKPRGRISR